MKQKQLLTALLCAVTPLAYAETTGIMDEVVVTATRVAQPLDQSLAHTTVIGQKEIRESQAVDVPSLLKNLAGVEVMQSGGIGKQSSLFVRGTNSSHVLVLLDGVRIGSATTGSTAIDQMMLDQIERIEVVRGNVSSLYGSEGIGGVIQIFTRRGKGVPAFNASAGTGSHNTQRATGGFGGEAGDTSFNVQVSKFKTDGVSSIKSSLVPTVNPDKDGYDNTSISANVRQRFSDDHSLSFSLFDSRADSQIDDPFGLATAVNNNRANVSKVAVTSDNRFGEIWQSKLQWAQGDDDLRSFTNGASSWNVRTIGDQLSWQNTLQFGEQQVLLGIDTHNQKVAASTAYTRLARQVDGLFAGYTGDYGSHRLQLNLRQDRYSDFGSAPTWQAGYGYDIGESLRVTANLGTAFKAPTFNDMYLPAAWGGNPALRPENSRNAEIGLHYSNGGQRINAVWFDNKVADLIQYQFPLTQNIAQARINGLEFAYDGRFGDTGVKAALTQQNPRDAQTGLALLRRAKLFANLGVTQKLGAWQVGGEWQHSGAREDIHITAWPALRLVLPAYDVVNLTAHYELNRQLGLSLRVDNLFNKDYMLAHGYNTLGRTLYVGLSYKQ